MGRGTAVEKVNLATGKAIGNDVLVDTPAGAAGDDRQALAADSNPNSPFANNLYVVWTQFNHIYPNNITSTAILCSRSTNGGVDWSAPIEISAAQALNNGDFFQQLSISVGPNGDVYIAYHSQLGYSGGNPDGKSGQVFVAHSSNGGASFTRTATQPFTPGQADITFNYQAYLNKGGKVVTASRTIPGALLDARFGHSLRLGRPRKARKSLRDRRR